LDIQYAPQFGVWLRAERKKRGISQKELAARIGTSQGRISAIEKGKPGTSAEMVGNLADGLGVPDIFAYIAAGYVQDLSMEAAELALQIQALPERERRIMRRFIEVLVEDQRREEQGEA
jgi:transcriptional regulator with XRE-family HTH domain